MGRTSTGRCRRGRDPRRGRPGGPPARRRRARHRGRGGRPGEAPGPSFPRSSSETRGVRVAPPTSRISSTCRAACRRRPGPGARCRACSRPGGGSGRSYSSRDTSRSRCTGTPSRSARCSSRRLRVGLEAEPLLRLLGRAQEPAHRPTVAADVGASGRDEAGEDEVEQELIEVVAAQVVVAVAGQHLGDLAVRPARGRRRRCRRPGRRPARSGHPRRSEP